MDDTTRDQFTEGRLAMRGAFVDLSDLARRAGVDEDRITELHGRFFDGNVAVKGAFRVAALLAEIRQPPGTVGDGPGIGRGRPRTEGLPGVPG